MYMHTYLFSKKEYVILNQRSMLQVSRNILNFNLYVDNYQMCMFSSDFSLDFQNHKATFWEFFNSPII